MSTKSQGECLLFDISCHSITKIIASTCWVYVSFLSKKNTHICVQINPGLNQNYYKYLLISKCLSIYFHLNFKNITCSPDQTTNYQFSLNKWIIKQSEWVLFVYMLLLYFQNHIICELIICEYLKANFVICCWIWWAAWESTNVYWRSSEKVY